MKCNEVNKKILHLLDGTLNETERTIVESHLEECSECNKVAKRAKEIMLVIEQEKDELVNNPFLASKVWSRIHKESIIIESSTSAIRRIAYTSVAAAGILLGIVIGTAINSTFFSKSLIESELMWSQLTDDYFPYEVYSPYEENSNN